MSAPLLLQYVTDIRIPVIIRIPQCWWLAQYRCIIIGDTMLIIFALVYRQMFLSSHYAGQDLVPKFRGGEPWKKVFGPVFIYLNSAAIGDDPFFLWEDAKIQVRHKNCIFFH